MDIAGTETASKTVGLLLRRSMLEEQMRSSAVASERRCTW